MDVIAIGEPLLEFNATTDGTLDAAEDFSVGYGGDTSNFVIAASRSGAKTAYLTRIGDDPFGDALMALWQRERVGTTHVTREPGGRTGIYFIARHRGGASFTYYRSGSPASRLSPSDVAESALARATAVHVTGITQAISASACDAAFHAMAVARRHGTLVTYDPNYRPALWPADRARAVVMRSMEMCDVALPNLEEGRILTGEHEPEKVLTAFAARGPRTVVLKMAERGALVSHEGVVTDIAAYPVTAVDASGAGDTFDGAFVARLIAGVEPSEAARYAAVAAALTTTGHGAVRPIPSAERVDAAIDTAMAR